MYIANLYIEISGVYTWDPRGFDTVQGLARRWIYFPKFSIFCVRGVKRICTRSLELKAANGTYHKDKTNQPINQPINKSTNQPINQSTNQ